MSLISDNGNQDKQASKEHNWTLRASWENNNFSIDILQHTMELLFVFVVNNSKRCNIFLPIFLDIQRKSFLKTIKFIQVSDCRMRLIFRKTNYKNLDEFICTITENKFSNKLFAKCTSNRRILLNIKYFLVKKLLIDKLKNIVNY